MKGLVMSDLLWWKAQRGLLGVIVCLTILYVVTDNVLFSLGFPGIFAVVLSSKTILNDLQEGTSRWYFSLPFSRDQYVLEKYLFPLGAAILVIALQLILYALFGMGSFAQLLMVAGGILAVLALIESVLIPVMIRFQARSTLVLMVSMVAFILAMLFVLPEDGLPAMTLPNPAVIITIEMCVVILALALSFLISRKLIGSIEI